MSTRELLVFRRPRRRSHLMLSTAYFKQVDMVMTMCGRELPAGDSTWTPVPLAGGATKRLKNDLRRELDENTCKHCARIAVGMLAIYVSRDTGLPW